MEDSQDTSIDGVEECEEWLRAHGAVLTVDNNGELQLDAKVLCITYLIAFIAVKRFGG